MKGNEKSPVIRTTLDPWWEHEFRIRQWAVTLRLAPWTWAIHSGDLNVEGVRFRRSRAAHDQAHLLTQMLNVQRPKK